MKEIAGTRRVELLTSTVYRLDASPAGIAPADCVRACVQKGANYALVVGDKVYTLKTSDKAALDELNKLDWEQAKVTGTASGDTISVKSVAAAAK